MTLCSIRFINRVHISSSDVIICIEVIDGYSGDVISCIIETLVIGISHVMEMLAMP